MSEGEPASASARLNITLLTRSLTRGGAQVQVATLARELNLRHSIHVATFYGGGAIGREIQARGIRVVDLGKSGRWNLIGPLRRLIAHIKDTRCDVLYSFLAMENLYGLAASRATRVPVVWGVRGSRVHRGQFGLASRLLYGLQFRLMPRADAVISNSRAAADEITGRSARSLHVVHNGIDCARFQLSTEQRVNWRGKYGIDPSVRLVGIVARLDPMKDHANFLQAATILVRHDTEFRFVIAGDGPLSYRNSLRAQAERLEIESRIIWLGEVGDLSPVYNALDVMVSCSAFGEGFSNSVGEAMACGTRVVATKVGDSAEILGSFGEIVEPRSPVQLAEAILRAIRDDRPELRVARREWIRNKFGPQRMASHTEEILLRLAAR